MMYLNLKKFLENECQLKWHVGSDLCIRYTLDIYVDNDPLFTLNLNSKTLYFYLHKYSSDTNKIEPSDGITVKFSDMSFDKFKQAIKENIAHYHKVYNDYLGNQIMRF